MKTFRTVHISLHETTRAAGRDPSGALAQLGERVLCKHEVTGSIPVGSTTPLLASAEHGLLGAPAREAGSRIRAGWPARRFAFRLSTGKSDAGLGPAPAGGCVAQVVRAYA